MGLRDSDYCRKSLIRVGKGELSSEKDRNILSLVQGQSELSEGVKEKTNIASHNLCQEHVLEALLRLEVVLFALDRLVVLVRFIEVGIAGFIVLLLCMESAAVHVKLSL